MEIIQGFSKLTREDKIELLLKHKAVSQEMVNKLELFRHHDHNYQKQFENISENVISNYILPYSIVPNVKINGKIYFVPLVTEESSVVAAASMAAKFWAGRGGFKTKVLSETKIGQIHFTWTGSYHKLMENADRLKIHLVTSIRHLTQRMYSRGGGLGNIEIISFEDKISDYYQIKVDFNTSDAMGANFINSCLEQMSKALVGFINNNFYGEEAFCEIIMSILSNYTPECIVECAVECNKAELLPMTEGLSLENYIKKFETAVQIAQMDVYRAVTHNKGIFNGIDAVLIATGNDFRAVEACGHAYASRTGQYTSLSCCENSATDFRFIIKVPMAIGTVGGMTRVHPMAGLSLKILNNPSAAGLMEIAAAVGMANHFAAITALITKGIQKGHMKMHLSQILVHLQANENEVKQVVGYFADKEISFNAASEYLSLLRLQSL